MFGDSPLTGHHLSVLVGMVVVGIGCNRLLGMLDIYGGKVGEKKSELFKII